MSRAPSPHGFALEMAAVYEGEIPLPSQVNKRVPQKLDAVVMRMLERKLDRRFQSAPELIRELNAAAGTLAWPREKCAELVKTRFASRQKEIEALVARIPARQPDPSALSTVMTRGPVSTNMLNDEESSARTLVGAQPLPPRRPPINTQPEREAATDPFKQPLLRPSDDTGKGLSVDELFEEDAPQPTRIIAGASIRNLPRAVSEAPTDPRRAAVARPGTGKQPQKPKSKVPLIIAAILALAIGGGGGAMLLKSLRKAAPPPPTEPAPTPDPVPVANPTPTPPKPDAPKRTMMKLSVSSDRPATVFLGEMELGETPVSMLVPLGQHRLEFAEDGGTRRMFDVELSGDEAEKKLAVTLDSLAPVP